MKTKRYDWCDALVEAQAMGVIGNGELTTGMKLARVILWEPKDKRPSGLYWANDLAADVAGVARATFYRNIKKLKETGFFVVDGGNLIPVLPKSQSETKKAWEARRDELVEDFNNKEKSQTDTPKSQSDTSESQSETSKSQSDNPYSVDTYSGESCSADLVSVDKDNGTAKTAVPSDVRGNDKEGSPTFLNLLDDDLSLTSNNTPASLNYEVENGQSLKVRLPVGTKTNGWDEEW